MIVAASPARDFYTAAELAAEWGMSEPGLRRLCARGRIPGARRFGGRWIIHRATLAAAFAAAPPPDPAPPAPPEALPARTPRRSLLHSDLNRMFTSGNIWDAKGGAR